MTRTCLLLVMAIMLALAGCGGGDGDSDRAVEGDMMQPGDGDGMQPDDMEPEPTAICANQDMPYTENLTLGSLLFNNNTLGGSDLDFEQCLLTREVDGEVQHGWSWDWPVDGQRVHRGLPSAIYGHKFWMMAPTPESKIPIQVSQILQIEKLEARFEVDLMADADSVYLLQFDLLFNSVYPPQQYATVAEVAIHLDRQSHGPGERPESLTFGGHTYDILHIPAGYFGPTTILEGHDTQYGGTIDLKAVIQEMVNRDFVLPESYLASIELNTVVFEGAGEVWVLEYEVDVVE